MTWDTVMDTATRDILRAAGGNGQMTYRGGAGEVACDGYVQQVNGLTTIGGVFVGEPRRIVSLRVSQVGESHRGDQVTDSNGVTWELLDKDELQSDEWISVWTVQRK